MPQFDLKVTLKRISPQLREELFSRWPPLAEIDWSSMQKQRAVDPLFDALQALPPEDKHDINVLLRSFENLRNATGLKVILEELEHAEPDLVTAWGEHKAGMDKIVWTYLKAKPVYEEAVIFARVDDLSTKRHWHKWAPVEHGEFAVTDDRISALGEELVNHHSGEFRGDTCTIHHYTRQNGTEYLLAYLPNWPDNFMVFNRDGELESFDLPTAFSISFVFTPATGVFEMIANGGQDTQLLLRRHFYKAMTGTDVDDVSPDSPAYDLDHILADDFAFVGHDTARVASVSIRRVTLFPTVASNLIEGLQPRFHREMPWNTAREQIKALLGAVDLDRTQVTVDEIRIRVQCRGQNGRNGRVLNIRVTPRACDLKSVDDEHLRVLGEDCLRAWGIDPHGQA